MTQPYRFTMSFTMLWNQPPRTTESHVYSHYHFHQQCGNQPWTTIKSHAYYLSAILALLTINVSLLINLTDLKFRKEADSVFQAQPRNTKVVVVSLLAFVLAFGIELTFHTRHLSPTCAALLRTTMVFFSSFSLASLASLVSWCIMTPSICHLCLASTLQHAKPSLEMVSLGSP